MRRLLVTFSMMALVMVGCGGDGEISSPPVSLEGQTSNHGTKVASDDLAVEVDNYYFGPTFITASAGQKFTIQLRNEGSGRHTFTSADLGIDLELAPGATRTVSINSPQSGTAEFHCRFHESQGMQGAVYVE